MALTSSSTLTDALAQYNDSLSWEGNATKAPLALEAVRWLLANRAQVAADGGTMLHFVSLHQESRRLDEPLPGYPLAA